MITVTISNAIDVSGLPAADVHQIAKTLSLPNPLHAKLTRMGNIKALYAVPEFFKYYSYDKLTNTLTVPRGMRTRLLAYLDKRKFKPAPLILEDTISPPISPLPPFKGKLRSHQEKALERLLEASEGILEASMGSGKTLIGLELTQRLQTKTLILVDKKMLGKQWQEEAKKFYNYTPALVCDGNTKTSDVTICTWQSLPKIIDKIKNQIGLVICDEAHTVPAEKRAELLQQLKPKHLYGLTATARRSKDDGQSEAIQFYLGPILFQHKQDQLKPVVEITFTKCKYREYEYHRLENAVMENENRNVLIRGLAAAAMAAGNKVLTLTKRVAHYKRLQEKLPPCENVYYIDAKDKNTPDLLQSFRDGSKEYQGIFGTFSLLATGLDIKDLDILILASSVKSDVLTAQACGRILRLFGNKQPKIYDLVDYGHPIYKRHYWERKKVYDNRGWKVVY